MIMRITPKENQIHKNRQIQEKKLIKNSPAYTELCVTLEVSYALCGEILAESKPTHQYIQDYAVLIF